MYRDRHPAAVEPVSHRGLLVPNEISHDVLPAANQAREVSMTLPVDKFMRINSRERRKPFGDDDCPPTPFTIIERNEKGTPRSRFISPSGHRSRRQGKRRTA